MEMIFKLSTERLYNQMIMKAGESMPCLLKGEL